MILKSGNVDVNKAKFVYFQTKMFPNTKSVMENVRNQFHNKYFSRLIMQLCTLHYMHGLLRFFILFDSRKLLLTNNKKNHPRPGIDPIFPIQNNETNESKLGFVEKK